MTVDLRELFLTLQARLQVDLRAGRIISHPGAKGQAAELDWLGMLSTHLPNRYQVAKAFVVDADGHQSHEIDIVIFDRYYSPLLFSHGGATFVPAESVYSVIEVKPSLNKQVLEYGATKAASVRGLRRTSVPVPQIVGGVAQREPPRILAGILCLESDWRPAFGDPFLETLSLLQPDGRIDFGCALEHGSFDVVYPDGGDLQVEVSGPDTALVLFFLRILERLREMGNVPAIDLGEYRKRLNSKPT
jgi:hypothetical protein